MSPLLLSYSYYNVIVLQIFVHLMKQLLDPGLLVIMATPFGNMYQSKEDGGED